MERVGGSGPTIFAAVLLTISGVLNGIYEIAAVGNSSFFVGDARITWGLTTEPEPGS